MPLSKMESLNRMLLNILNNTNCTLIPPSYCTKDVIDFRWIVLMLARIDMKKVSKRVQKDNFPSGKLLNYLFRKWFGTMKEHFNNLLI